MKLPSTILKESVGNKTLAAILDETKNGINWGTKVIPKKFWIDPTKKYTCGGNRVENITIVLHNSCGDEVTYPVKGTIILREKPLKTTFAIWSLDGRADVVWGKGNNLKLVN